MADKGNIFTDLLHLKNLRIHREDATRNATILNTTVDTCDHLLNLLLWKRSANKASTNRCFPSIGKSNGKKHNLKLKSLHLVDALPFSNSRKLEIFY